MNIYGIAMKVAKKEYEGFFKKKEKIQWYGGYKIFPILANSEKEAIEKFKLTREYKKRCTYSLCDIEYENPEAVDVDVYIYNINKFTIDQLKRKLSADDFMTYIRSRLSIPDVVEEVIK